MAEQPADFVLRPLREIRADVASVRETLEGHSARFDRLEKRLNDVAKIVTYTLGHASETQFRQTEPQSRLDGLFDKVEKLLSVPHPSTH